MRDPHFSLSPLRLAFLAWGDFHARSLFAGFTIPEEIWGLLVVYQNSINQKLFGKFCNANLLPHLMIAKTLFEMAENHVNSLKL